MKKISYFSYLCRKFIIFYVSGKINGSINTKDYENEDKTSRLK